MADNIKIVGNIINTSTVSRYDEKDINLIISRNLQEYFGGTGDYIEYYIYDAGSNLLSTDYNYLNYKLPPSSGLKPGTSNPPNTTGNIQTENVGVDSTLAPQTSSLYPTIEIDPVQDIQNIGYSSGEFITNYYFFSNKLSNPTDRALFVKEISSDRTEIRLASTTLTNDEIESVANSMIDEINNSTYYVDYLLNFGNNKQYVAVNIALNKATTGYEVLFKLYQPLPLEVQEKDTLWVVSEKVSSYSFDINLDKIITPPPPPTLRGPNFDVPVKEGGTVATTYTNYQSALTSLQSLQSSSYNQIQNLLNTQSIQINVDYTVSESADFGNFIFFGSAYQRLTNFYTKVKQIEDYNVLINKYKPNVSTTSSLQAEINLYSSSINTLVSQFDGFESYLYFESSSYTWPKSGSLKPYSLLSTGSATVISWYNNITSSAQTYDLENYSNLEYIVPNFMRDDENNVPYLTFLNMIGQYFDNIWIYLKAITDVNLANNNLNKGISKDLVYNQLQSLGIKLYNSQAGEALDSFLIGANTGSSIWNNDFSITSSYLNNIPRKDLVSELYKRIYHNLPLLLKTKGTVEGLDNLMTIFGIPNKTYYTIISGSVSESFYTPTGSNSTASILNVKEYGGSLKSGLLKGYNNDKVRIVSNEIVTGSVLSPIMSLQTYPSKSSQFRDDDLNYVDVSFSPQTQINTYISGAIASNAPTWNLDDYIGDPRYLYSSSYTPLDTERRKYFQVGVSGYAPFTASALDYNGFIRLIEYFDNALFKMFNDFVPERTSLSTGVTIESPVLERNKAVYANPTNTTTQSVYEANYSSSGISSDYGHFYDALTGSKKAWYDGDITGSYIDVYDYFENSNPNPYLQAASSSFTTSSLYEFQHSDFNVLLNNVSKSVTSLNRKKIEYIWGTTSSILTPPELQDSYLTLKSYNTSRYDGSKTYSLKYNDYTSNSGSIIIDSFVNNVTYSFISSSFNWAAISNTSGNAFYTILVLTGSVSQLTEISTKFTTPEVKYIRFSDINYILPNTVVDTTYKVYNITYAWDEALVVFDYTKLVLAISPILKSGSPPTATGQFPTISSDYGPGILNLSFYKDYGGDYSYGKTAAIDRQSYKLGWVRTLQSQSLNFYEKTTINLKYLIDPNLQITELSANNTNLFEVQNIFKSGTPVKISITNRNSPSSQITLDGVKTIFRGGYRYDPIIFREKNEIVTFTFDEPVSQSIGYLNVNAKSNYYYQYYGSGLLSGVNNYGLREKQPSESPLNKYDYITNDPSIDTTLSMASDVIDEIAWLSSSLATSNGTNFTYTGSGYNLNNSRLGLFAYPFPLLRFPLITDVDESELENYSDGTDYIYKVPRTSQYSISAQVPFYFQGNDHYENVGGGQDWGEGAVGFKAITIIEKTNNPSDTESWTVALSSSLQLIDKASGVDMTYEPPNNFIWWDTAGNNSPWGFFMSTISLSSIPLNQGDYLRVRFYILSITDIFGKVPITGNNFHGVNWFKFRIGGTGVLDNVNYTDNYKSFFKITDENSAYDIFDYTKSYPATNTYFPLFITGSNDATIEIKDQELISCLTSPSIFTPTSQSQQYYTEVIDKFGFLKGDLLRLGEFKTKNPTYYNILDAELREDGPIALSITWGSSYFRLPLINYTYGVFYPGQNLTISDSSIGNDGNFYVSSIYTSGSYFYVQSDVNTSQTPGLDTSPTINFNTKNLIIYLDRTISNINSSYFAVLRPKPDETTVIVNHLKKPGDVSQTLLIPSDASQLLKNKTGDIFDYYNIRLNPNTNQSSG